MGYILVFLVCHSPRLMLNIYELFTIRQAMECQTVGLDAFPLWPQVKTVFLHLAAAAVRNQSNPVSRVKFHLIMKSSICTCSLGLHGVLASIPRTQLVHQHSNLQPAQLQVPRRGLQRGGEDKVL